MEIVRLSDAPECAEATAKLMAAIWPDHYGPGGEGDAMADVFSRIAEDRSAIARLDGAVIGTVAISEQSFGAQGDGPWLVGLCTDPAHRGKGVASALTLWVMGLAHKQSRRALFATTREAEGIFARLGWQELREISDASGTWSVWRIVLKGSATV